MTEFDALGLDDRLLRSIRKQGWKNPFLIQSAAIPLALQGKDILARAKTGSGKTAAYSLPILQELLAQKDRTKEKGISRLIIVPTKELCEQVTVHFSKLIHDASKEITVFGISGDVSMKEQIPRLKELPDILVSTPNRLLAHLKAENIILKDTLKSLVIDEADLILSYGYEEDIQAIVEYLPEICQSFLMSATLTPEVEGLKKLVLHTPAILKLEEPEVDIPQLTEYYLKCLNTDKFLIIYALIRLKVIPGKAIIFVNDIDTGYRLKLFLERFFIKSAILNSELPQNSRSHILQEFNRGVFNYLIATDEMVKSSKGIGVRDEESGDEENEEKEEENEEKESTKKSKKNKRDKEYGVARGVDFKGVQTVINFDFPSNVKNYVHRVGRTARAGAKGTALSFVTPSDEVSLLKVEETRIEQGCVLQAYKVNMNVVEGLRYRVEDILRSVTRISVREARLKELKAEIVNSEKLKTHFEENPKELNLLKHDSFLEEHKQKPHLKYIPSYVTPTPTLSTKEISSKKRPSNSDDSPNPKKKAKNDPLRTFKYGTRKSNNNK